MLSDHMYLSILQRRQRKRQLLMIGCVTHLEVRRRLPLIGDQVQWVLRILTGGRLIQLGQFARPHKHLSHTIHRDTQNVGNLIFGCFNARLLLDFSRDLCDAVQELHAVRRQATGTRILRQTVQDDLADPPSRLGDEPHSGSNRSAAVIKPALPALIRSSRSIPHP